MQYTIHRFIFNVSAGLQLEGLIALEATIFLGGGSGLKHLKL